RRAHGIFHRPASLQSRGSLAERGRLSPRGCGDEISQGALLSGLCKVLINQLKLRQLEAHAALAVASTSDGTLYSPESPVICEEGRLCTVDLTPCTRVPHVD
ncbi:hypothetical protein H1C71_041605, partial [Ictidomys tridecemlineatus]